MSSTNAARARKKEKTQPKTAPLTAESTKECRLVLLMMRKNLSLRSVAISLVLQKATAKMPTPNLSRCLAILSSTSPRKYLLLAETLRLMTCTIYAAGTKTTSKSSTPQVLSIPKSLRRSTSSG